MAECTRPWCHNDAQSKLCESCKAKARVRALRDYYKHQETRKRLAREKEARRRASGTVKSKPWDEYTPEQKLRAVERAKAWKMANPEKAKASRDRRLPQRVKYNREWIQARPETRRAKWHKEEAKRKARPGLFTAADVRELLKYQGGLCAYCHCHVGEDYHVDHKIPVSRGGPNWPSNLAIACKNCNLRKGKRTVEEFLGQEDTRVAA